MNSTLPTYFCMSIRSRMGPDNPLPIGTDLCRGCTHNDWSLRTRRGKGSWQRTSMKSAGYLLVWFTRLIVTFRSSRGNRSDSRVFLPNSGSSSRNRTPRWASVHFPRHRIGPSPMRAWGGHYCNGENERTTILELMTVELACDAVDGRDFQYFMLTHRWEYGGQ